MNWNRVRSTNGWALDIGTCLEAQIGPNSFRHGNRFQLVFFFKA